MGMRAAMGSRFIAGDTFGVTYTPEHYAEYRQLRPDAPNCSAAASAHHADEVEQYRAAAGVLGVVVLAAWPVAFGQRWRRGDLRPRWRAFDVPSCAQRQPVGRGPRSRRRRPVGHGGARSRTGTVAQRLAARSGGRRVCAKRVS
jgi:hypothetical protein